MSDGGGRLAPLRTHWKLTSAVAVALATLAVAVPVVLADSADTPPCQAVPTSTRALADDPTAATRALDPGADMGRMTAVRALFVERPCGDGGEALGRVVDAGTRTEGQPHTLEQARSAYGVVLALGKGRGPLPTGLTTAAARLLGEYVVDQNLYFGIDRDARHPAVTADQAASAGFNPGRFLSPGEAHVDFSYSGSSLAGDARINALLARTVWDPEAFAIVYDAERAYFAHYLERLTDDGADPDHEDGAGKGSPTSGPDRDLSLFGNRFGALMGLRTEFVRDGTIPDLAAFDRTVREHTRGTYAPAGRRVTSRPAQGTIAARPVSGTAEGELMDGRGQVYPVLEKWAAARKTPGKRVAEMRRAIDGGYVPTFAFPY